jgi:dihydroorotate dehydrogenase (fumarate)
LSVYPYQLEDLDKLFDNDCQIIEVNLSCPHVNNNITNYESYLYKINQMKGDKIVGLKLPPFFNPQHIIDLSLLLLKYNIDFITCCNTVPHCLVIQDDAPVLHNTLGGMSFKFISLSNVYQFYKLLQGKIDIIGCGGVQTGQDIYDYILCGATAVQVGSHLLRHGVDCFNQLEEELKKIMIKKGYHCLNDFKGYVKNKSSKL